MTAPDSDFIVIADLHLQPEEHATMALANRFLATLASRTRHLYIAGDLVEYWIGDDAHVDDLIDTVRLLRDLADQGTAITVMHGNRDFLLGNTFAARINGRIERDDHIVITTGDRRVLLLHGDTLCTDDHRYQSMRAQLRSQQWQQAFLAQSVEARHAFARSARQQSREDTQRKSDAIMDVNHAAVTNLMTETGITDIVHGHTHRPAVHNVALPATQDGRHTAGQRWVVGDWHPDHAMYVEASNGMLALKRWPPLIDTAKT